MAIRFAHEAPKPAPRKPPVTKRKHAGGRPKLANPKVVLNIRVDADVLARWKASGKGWQKRLNDAIRTLAPVS